MRTPEEMKALLSPDVPDELASSIVDLIVIAVREAVEELTVILVAAENSYMDSHCHERICCCWTEHVERAASAHFKEYLR